MKKEKVHTSLGVLNPRPTDLMKRCSLALVTFPATRFLFWKIVGCFWKAFSV